MRVLIAADDAADTDALYSWLRADADVARQAQVRAVAPGPGGMGALEVVDIVLTHATAVSNLALAVVAWRQARGKPESITITRPHHRRHRGLGRPAVLRHHC